MGIAADPFAIGNMVIAELAFAGARFSGPKYEIRHSFQRLCTAWDLLRVGSTPGLLRTPIAVPKNHVETRHCSPVSGKRCAEPQLYSGYHLARRSRASGAASRARRTAVSLQSRNPQTPHRARLFSR